MFTGVNLVHPILGGGTEVQTPQERLRGLREDNDLSQTEIAELLGTSQTMYSRYERGATEIPTRHLVVLCEFFNVSSDEILGIKLNPRRKRGEALYPLKKE